MREILFKAKRKDNGEWVEGYYGKLGYRENVKHYIIQNVSLQKDISYFEDIEICLYTLCQYTGLVDKNGKKIWENDIVKFDKSSNYPIVWNEEYCTFGSCYYSDFDHLSKYRNTDMEVVGNIFDNGELLEAKE